MQELIVRELVPDDAEQLIAYTKQIGGESDNLTFGADGFPVTVEDSLICSPPVAEVNHPTKSEPLREGVASSPALGFVHCA